MAFTEGNDTAYLRNGGTGTYDFLGGVDTLDMGEAVKSQYTITANADGYIHIDSVSGASSRASLHILVKNLELIVWRDGTVNDLRTMFDTTAPTVLSATPADKAAGIAVASDIVFTFSETIQKGSGTVTITNAAGAVVETIAVSSSNVTVSGSKLTINPVKDLAYSGSYTVQLSAGSVKDSAGNALAAPAAISFSTGKDPAYTGTANADVFNASAGSHIVDGGAGTDTLALGALARAAFTLSHSGSTYNLTAADGSSSYALSSVERLKFADYSVALDLDGNAGKTAKILGAVFGADAVSNKAYAGIGLQLLDSGTSYEALLQLALDVRLGVGASNKAVVDLLYTNVVGTAPSAADAAPFVGLLDSKAYTPASLAVMAADTDLNANRINLAGLFDTGLAYTPA